MATHGPYDSFNDGRYPQRPTPTVNAWLVLILLGLVATLVFQSFRDDLPPLHDPNAKPREITPRGDLAADEKSNIEIFREAAPSVVYITTLAVRRDLVSRNLLEIPQGSGSGFIWDSDGHIVTNYHVIAGAYSAEVSLADNSRVFKARLVGAAPNKDLAVLKIDAPKRLLRPIRVGTSADLQVGQKAYAIGNPFGLDHSFTTGVIGGLGREFPSASGRPIKDAIQTDAAINPGNSGGPLLDSAARLIGVNTAIASLSGTYAGIGFAVPVDVVNEYVPKLIRDGRVDQPGLGIIFESVSTEIDGVVGILVNGVTRDGPAAKAGIQPSQADRRGGRIPGDLVVGIDGERVENPKQLYDALEGKQIGDVVAVTVLRNGQEITLNVTLEPLALMNE